MTEEIDLGGIKIPAVDGEATPESIRLALKFLLEDRKKIEELEEKLNKNSGNSSIPPSKNGFATNVKSKVKPKKKPASCSNCEYELVGEDTTPHRHQVVDLPALTHHVAEYRLHELECERCGKKKGSSKITQSGNTPIARIDSRYGAWNKDKNTICQNGEDMSKTPKSRKSDLDVCVSRRGRTHK